MKQEIGSGSGISWAICKSAPSSRQITTPVPHHFPSSTEIIFVPVCLRTPGYRLMIVLWCALGLPEGGAIQVPQLQLHCFLVALVLRRGRCPGEPFSGEDLPGEQKSKHPEKRRCSTEPAKTEQFGGGVGLRHRGEEIIGAGVDRE